jgi:2-iminobutanoate/2-iminopropanoate deaminase
MAYISAVGPVDPETSQVHGYDIRKHTQQCLRNLKALLEALDSSLDRVVWAYWSLRESSEFDTFCEEWQEFFDRQDPVGQGTLMPLSHRRAGFRVSLGVIAATKDGYVRDASADPAAMIAALSSNSTPAGAAAADASPVDGEPGGYGQALGTDGDPVVEL